MIEHFVKQWEARKHLVRDALATEHPEGYGDIVKLVVSILTDNVPDMYVHPDSGRIHLIDDGDYQGTQVFVIGSDGYQPSDYWYVKVSYGSCSGCDTLEAIRDYSNEKPTEEQVSEYMQLALHIVQGLRQMNEDAA